MLQINKQHLNILIISLIFTIIPLPSLAATFSIESDKNNANLETSINVQINLISENEQLNAFSGELKFPSDKLQITEIKTGNSLVNFWIEEPVITVDSDTVIFSGITPGGFSGSGNIFTASFITKAPGVAEIVINEAQALINDGFGSAADINISSAQIEIEDLPEKTDVIIIDLTDNAPPESFSPIITRLPDITNNDSYVIIFHTSDKQSGVDYYEIKEGNLSKKRIKSPYILENQKLDKDITITAVDKRGNKRTEVIKLKPKTENKDNNYYYLIIFVIIILLSIFVKNIFKKKKNDVIK